MTLVFKDFFNIKFYFYISLVLIETVNSIYHSHEIAKL